MLKIAFLSLAFLVSAASLAAPGIKDYGSLPNTSMMSISPNGKTVAFRTVQDDRDMLSVISLTEKKLVSGLDLTKIQPKSIFFANDDSVYLKASEYGRVAGFRGKFESSTGFVLDIPTNKVRQLLIPGEHAVYPGQTGLGQVIGFTKDRDYALMPAYVGSTDLMLGRSVAPNYSLLKVNINKRTRHRRESTGGLHSVDFFVDEEGSLVAEERYDQKENRHSLWAMKDGRLEEVFAETLAVRTKSFVGLTPDYSSVVFLETDEQTGRSDYFLLNVASGTIAKADFGKSDADIEAVISDSNRVVHGVRYSGFSPSYYFFDAALNSRVAKILDSFAEQSVWIVDQTPDWKNIVVYVEGSSFVGDYYLVGNDNKSTFLAFSRRNISHENVNPIGKITLAARDGLPIPTLLTIPQSAMANMKNLPAVVFPHGGPRSYDRIGFNYFAQALASEGYMVIQPQFRGSTGFGQKHANAGNGEWGRKMHDDITDTVKALGEKGIINPQKVCIAGMSYGGYAALAGGAFTPDLYKCVVSVNGVADLARMYQWAKYERGSYHESVSFWEMQFAANSDGDVDKAEMKARSPESHAEKFTAPVLLIHGENDDVVPFKQSEWMRAALRKHKKPVELIKLKGDNHHLQNNETRVAALEATVKFINSHLKP